MEFIYPEIPEGVIGGYNFYSERFKLFLGNKICVFQGRMIVLHIYIYQLLIVPSSLRK